MPDSLSPLLTSSLSHILLATPTLAPTVRLVIFFRESKERSPLREPTLHTGRYSLGLGEHPSPVGWGDHRFALGRPFAGWPVAWTDFAAASNGVFVLGRGPAWATPPRTTSASSIGEHPSRCSGELERSALGEHLFACWASTPFTALGRPRPRKATFDNPTEGPAKLGSASPAQVTCSWAWRWRDLHLLEGYHG